MMKYRLLALSFVLASVLAANAQSFEIRVINNGSNTLAVQMRETSGGTNTPVFGDAIQDISFGLYWLNSLNANLGSITTSYSIIKSGSETVSGSEEYQLFTLSSATTVPSTWTTNSWENIITIPVTGTTTGNFDLVDASQYGGGYEPYLEINVTGSFSFLNPTINGGAALPVTLTHFNALIQNQTDAKLTWQTATEENNRGFYVERSVDGKNWDVVNFTSSLAPGGNSDILVDYQYIDMNVYKPWTGISTYYYRLRQQDINGDEEFVGGIKAVRFNEEGTASLVSTYPNPASNVINITVKDGAPTQFNVVDMSGRSVMRGSYSPSVDVSALQAGNYQLTVTDITGAVLGTRNIIIAR